MDIISMRALAVVLSVEWGTRPYFVLACQGGSDEHWQVWHPEDFDAKRETPRYIITPLGTVERHP